MQFQITRYEAIFTVASDDHAIVIDQDDLIGQTVDDVVMASFPQSGGILIALGNGNDLLLSASDDGIIESTLRERSRFLLTAKVAMKGEPCDVWLCKLTSTHPKGRVCESRLPAVKISHRPSEKSRLHPPYSLMT